MEQLPLDILVQIVETSNPYDHGNIRLACKILRDAVEGAAVRLRPRGELTGAQLVQLSSKFPRAVILQLESYRLQPTEPRGIARMDTVVAAVPEILLNLPLLESLVLCFDNLTELPACITNLTMLRVLDLGGCSSLNSLPEAMNAFVRLVHLDIECCWRLRGLPEALWGLRTLETMNLECSTNLTSMPEAVGQLTRLQTLNLKGYNGLRTLPAAFRCLSSLEARPFFYDFFLPSALYSSLL